MTGEILAEGMWDACSPSSKEHLQALENESYREASLIYAKQPDEAKQILDSLIRHLDMQKMVSDMYVWERVDAIKRGVARAHGERVK